MSSLAPHSPSRTPGLQTILVVEDEVLVRLVIADYLRECGYKVCEASNVAEAKAVLAAERDVQIVFTDVQMPGPEDGFALATWIRHNHGGIRVILTSGMVGAAERARDLCHEGGFVEKPYDHQLVLSRIREAPRSAGNTAQGAMASAV